MSDSDKDTARAVPEKQMAMIRDHFEFCDKDGNGKIDFDEFASLLKILSPDCTTAQAAAGFSITDTNSDGAIDLDEFVEWWQSCWYEY